LLSIGLRSIDSSLLFHSGKNHLGDLNKFLPTAHGVDDFFGDLYHLNAEEEPELPDHTWVFQQNRRREET